MAQTSSMWLEQGHSLECNNANSVYLVTPKGAGWETVVIFEKIAASNTRSRYLCPYQCEWRRGLTDGRN